MVTFMFDFRRSILMESTRLSMVVREDHSWSVVYREVGPLSSWMLDFCLVLLVVEDSYLLFRRVSSRAVSCFSEMGGDWNRYLDDE